MPRQVDHDQRRAELAEAAWRVARQSGVAALTVRAVAAEAGRTSGIVQHYFPRKQDLLRHAFDLVQQRTVGRIERIADHEPPDRALADTVLTLLPLDADVKAESEVWSSFLGLAAGDPELRLIAQQGHRELLGLIAAQVRRTARSGWLRADLDPDDVAGDLLAFADGLNLQALFRGEDVDAAGLTAAVDRRLAELAA